MRHRGLYVLIIVLVVLLVITLIYREARRPPGSLKLLPDFGQIGKVAVSRGDSTITMELVGDEWRITSPIESPTDGDVVDEFVESLKLIELTEVVTRRPEMYETFQVDEEQGTRMSVVSSSDSSSFIVGKSAGLEEGYLRPGSEDAVYLARNLPRYPLTKELDYWRDKSILSVPREDVEEIAFTYSSESFSLRKEEGLWKCNGTDIDSNRVRSILATLENFRADGFSYPGEFEPEVTIELKLADGKREKILIGKSTEHHYPVLREGYEAVFLVSTWKVDRLKKKQKDLH